MAYEELDFQQAPQFVRTATQINQETPGTPDPNFTVIGEPAVNTAGWTGVTLWVVCPTTPNGTLPKLDVRVEHSPDGTNWATLVSFAQIDAVGNYFVPIPANEGGTGPRIFSQFLRVLKKVTGTGTCNWPDCQVLISPRVR